MKYRNVIKGLIFFLLSTGYFSLYSQEKDPVPVFDIFSRLAEDSGGNITINADNGVESLLKKHFTQSSKTIKGWRIRIHRDNRKDARQRSESIRSQVMHNFPEVTVYLSYQAPYFYVSVGDYLTRDSAEKMKRLLQESYPGASLVETTINFPTL